jgi:putative ABC transport system ATP-binding protein
MSDIMSSSTTQNLAVSRVLSGLAAVRAAEVCYSFGEGETKTQVLFDNWLDIGRGEVVILTGPSGSGKTTLLTLIGTLRRMQQGSLVVLGRELAHLGDRRQVELRKEIGFIFQHHNLFSSLTALENVRMGAGLGRARGAAEVERRCAAILAELGLGERLGYLPARLSGGQRQRVAIARALVNRPAMVLADEPTAALDASSGDTVLNMLRSLADGRERTTVLIVTHDQRILDRADRIVNMVNGRIVSNVRPKELVKIVRVLKQLKELEGLSDLTLTRLGERMTVERHRPGETIVREAVDGTRVYLIGEGVAEAFKNDTLIRELTVGQSFGTITAVFHRDNPETVRARSSLELYVLTGDDLIKVMSADQGLDERVQMILMARQE